MADSSEQVEPAEDILVGISYFAGWWEPLPNKWTVRGQDWRPQYPERIPLLGEYNNQDTMNRRIVAPTRGEQYMKLKMIQRVFDRQPRD